MRKSTRLIALLMTLLMLVGMMPFSTFAVPSGGHDHDENSYAGESVTSANVADITAKVEAMGGTLHYFDNFEDKLSMGVDLQKLPYQEGAELTGVVGTAAYKNFSGAMAVERNSGNVAVKFSQSSDNTGEDQSTFLSPVLGFSGKDFVFSFDYKHGGTGAGTVSLGANYGGALRSFAVISFKADGSVVANHMNSEVIGYTNSDVFTTIALRADITANKLYYYINGAVVGETTLFTDAYLAECTNYNGGTAVTKDNIVLGEITMFKANGAQFSETGFYVDNVVVYCKDAGGDLGYIDEDTVAEDNRGFVEANGKVYYLANNSRVSLDTYVIDGLEYYFNDKGEVLAADRISLVDVQEHLDANGNSNNVANIYAESNGLYAVKSGRYRTVFSSGKGLTGGATLADFLEGAYVEWNVYTDGPQANTVIPLYFNFETTYTNGSPLNINKEVNFDTKTVSVYTAGAASKSNYGGALGQSGWYTITRPSAPTGGRLDLTLTNLQSAGKTADAVALKSIDFKTGEDWGNYIRAIYAADGTTEIFNVDYCIYFTSINLVKYLRPATSIEDMEMTGWVETTNGDKYYFPTWDHKLVKGATVDLDGVGYVFDEDGKLVGKANGVHEVQFGDVHYYKDGVMQVGDGYSKYVDGDKVYAVNASGDYLGLYADYTFAKAYSEITRTYERDDYIVSADFNSLTVGKNENQGTSSPVGGDTDYLGVMGLTAVRGGAHSEIVADTSSDKALKWNGYGTKLETYLEMDGIGADNVALSFDIKLGNDWSSAVRLVDLVTDAPVSVLDINRQGYIMFGDAIVAKLNAVNYTSVTVVIRTPGLEGTNYVAYADVYINGAKIIDNAKFYDEETALTSVNKLRCFAYEYLVQAESMYIDDLYLYALEEGELPDNVDSAWTYNGPIGLAQDGNGVNFFYGANGTLIVGSQDIAGDIYLFDSDNGAGVQGVVANCYYDNGKRDDVSVGLVTKPDGQYYFNANHTVKTNETIIDGLVSHVIDDSGLVTTKYANKGELLFDAGDIRKQNNAGTLEYNKDGSELLYSMLANQNLLMSSEDGIDLTSFGILRIKMFIPEAFDDSSIMFVLNGEATYRPLAYTQLSDLGSGWVTLDLVLAQYGVNELINEIQLVNSGECYISASDAEKLIKIESVTAVGFGDKDEALNGIVGNYFYENGVPQTGWQNVGGDFYYFDPVTGKKVTGIKYTPTVMPTRAASAGLYYDFGESGICNGAVNGIRDVEIPVVTDSGVVTKTVSRLFQSGVVASNGFVTNEVNHKTYYADPETGALIKDATVKIEGTIYTFDESGIASGLNGWYTDEETGEKYYGDPVNGLATGLTVIENEYYFFDETTSVLKTNYWSDSFGMYFGADGKAANGIVDNVLTYGTMYFVDGVPTAANIDVGGFRYLFGDDGKLISKINLNAAEVVITIKKDGNTDVLNFKPSMGAMFVYTVPNYPDYDVAVFDKDLNDVTDSSMMIVIDSVTGYIEYTIVYSETLVSHDWVLKPEFSTPATCMDDGLNVFECSVCGKVKKEVVDKSTVEHTFTPFIGVYCEISGCNHLTCGGWAKAREESCTTAGIRYTYCTECNKGISYETIDAAHDWDKTNYAVLVEPRCNEEGLAEYNCRNCTETLVEKFRDPDNRYHAGPVSEEVIKDPTCVAQGVKKYTCESCGGTWTDTIEIDSSNHNLEEPSAANMLEAATCYTGKNKYALRCVDCGTHIDHEVDVPAGQWIHDYDDGVLNPAPTCGDPGLKVYTCQNPACGVSYNEPLDETGLHTWKDTYDRDTEQHWYECSVCGDKKDVEGHILNTWVDDTTGTHTGSCVCGYSVVGVPHEYEVDEVSGDRVFYTDGTNHWYKCSVCAAELDKTTHTHVADKDAEYHWKECECGDIIDKAAHEHTIPNYDETNHWDECSCGDKINIDTHTLGQNFDENNHWNECECDYKTGITGHSYATDDISGDRIYSKDGEYHWYDCTGCGYDDDKVAHTHVANKNEEEHWEECECGDKINVDTHTFEQNFDETNHWDECSCGYTKNTVGHTYATDDVSGERIYASDDEYHWYDCTGCGYDDAKELHSFEQGHDANEHWQFCLDCGHITDKVEHNVTAITEAKEATCTQMGNSEGSWCPDCGVVFVPVEEYGMLSHDVMSTMVSNSEGHYYACRNCNTKLDFEQHTFETEWTHNDKEHKRVCVVCNARDPQSGAHTYLGEEYYTNIDDEEGTATTKCEFCEHETEVEILTWYEKLGMTKVDGKYYYPVGGVNVTNKFVEFDDGVRFFGADGALIVDAADITDNALTPSVAEYITFQNARGIINDAAITLDEGTYCVKAGVIQKNSLVVIGTRYFYFDENALMVKNTIVDIEEDGTPDYWFDENGMGYKLVVAEA